jgi:putative heme transporter
VAAPIVHGKVIEVSPMVVMFAILAGGTLAGVVGAIIAIPLVAVIDLLIEDVLLPLRHGEATLREAPAE